VRARVAKAESVCTTLRASQQLAGVVLIDSPSAGAARNGSARCVASASYVLPRRGGAPVVEVDPHGGALRHGEKQILEATEHERIENFALVVGQ
jgi:putative IMPACT (imprinted ancient) family translation regulator